MSSSEYEYALHYAGDTFPVSAEEAAAVEKAIELAAEGKQMVITLDSSTYGVRCKFLFTAGVPVYLTTPTPPADA